LSYPKAIQQKHFAVSLFRKMYWPAIATMFVATALAKENQASLEKRFTTTVQPFLENYCLRCHDHDTAKGDFDMSAFGSAAAVGKDFGHWDLAIQRLEANEMPPKKARKFPSASERKAVIDWIASVRRFEADRNAGDPGVVLARRLSNAEYDYTIHDLTGADIRPTREFPVDPANQAGFDNSGESLTMSPALLKKYLQAAKDVSEHLLLKPDGIGFAPFTVMVETDRDKYCVLRIVDFYQRQPTDYADYFEAAWRFKNRGLLGTPKTTLADIATQSKVSPKYLKTVWDALTAKEEIGPIAKVQSMWRELPPPANEKQPEEVRSGCVAMRSFVVDLREKIKPEVKNLSAPGINPRLNVWSCGKIGNGPPIVARTIPPCCRWTASLRNRKRRRTSRRVTTGKRSKRRSARSTRTSGFLLTQPSAPNMKPPLRDSPLPFQMLST